MCELPIESKKYGKFIVQYDECDEALVSGYPWYIAKNGGTFYVATMMPRINGKRKRLLMHRLIMGAHVGEFVDHINHVGWCNTRANLRLCSSKENSRNRLKTKTKTSSQYKGVCWNKHDSKWKAQIKIDDKLKYLGYFSDEVIAAKAYDEAALIQFGPYAQLNFPIA